MVLRTTISCSAGSDLLSLGGSGGGKVAVDDVADSVESTGAAAGAGGTGATTGAGVGIGAGAGSADGGAGAFSGMGAVGIAVPGV